MSGLSRKRKLLFGCFSLGLSVIFAFTLTEIVIRATRPYIDIFELTGRTVGVNPMSAWAVVDAFCAYRPKSGRYAAQKTVSSMGFISTPEITVDKPEGTVRIVFLGGSSTAGTGKNLADSETWPWRAVEMTRTHVSQDVDFINAAAGGYSSFESYGRLWSRLRTFSPDIVVVCHGWNEMYYFRDSGEILSWRTLPDGSWSLATSGEAITAYSPLAVDAVVRRSQILSRMRLLLSQPLSGEAGKASGSPLATDFDHAGPSIWRTNLRLIREACRVIGARLFVVKQPTLIVPDLPEELRGRCRYEYHGFDHDAHVRAFSEIYRVIDEEIPDDFVIDATELSGRPEIFFDHVHPTPMGTTEMAEIVSRSLVVHLREMGDDRGIDRSDGDGLAHLLRSVGPPPAPSAALSKCQQ